MILATASAITRHLFYYHLQVGGVNQGSKFYASQSLNKNDLSIQRGYFIIRRYMLIGDEQQYKTYVYTFDISRLIVYSKLRIVPVNTLL